MTRPLPLKYGGISRLLGLCCMHRLEADLIYPLLLHDLANSLPTLPNNISAWLNMTYPICIQQRTTGFGMMEGKVVKAFMAMQTLLGEIKKTSTPLQVMFSCWAVPPFHGVLEAEDSCPVHHRS